MTEIPHPLPADVVEAIERGEKLIAIKLLRAATGAGLKEAKDAVEAHGRGAVASVGAAPAGGGEMPSSVLEALAEDRPIEAIRRLREATGLGLREAKDVVDGLRVRATPGREPEATRADAGGPSEDVPDRDREPARRGALPWLLLAAAVALAVAIAMR